MLDLFGEVPVTWPEIWDWIEAVPRISRHSWRAQYYVKHWNVAEKVRAAKINGTYHDTIRSTDPRIPYLTPTLLSQR